MKAGSHAWNKESSIRDGKGFGLPASVLGSEGLWESEAEEQV